MPTECPGAEARNPELVWVGHGAWVARDPDLSDDDARRVIAYIEHRDHRVDVVWVRERRDVSNFETLRDALDEVARSCGEHEQASVVRASPGDGSRSAILT
ncbi:hypothetical protein [Microbacterium sp.]|jgi:hypothetical protein|uniref:hypothetical protein n=1 Tax=Microbacterium sp. TaxID=51671 RepID=UPI0037C76495